MKISDIRIAIKDNRIKCNRCFLFARSKPRSQLIDYLKAFLKSHAKEERALTIDEEFELAQVLFGTILCTPHEINMAEELQHKLWGENAKQVFKALRIIYKYDHLDPTHWPEKYERIMQARRRAMIAAYLMVSLPLARETANFIDFIKQPDLPHDLIYASILELHQQRKLTGEAISELEEGSQLCWFKHTYSVSDKCFGKKHQNIYLKFN